MNFRKWILLGIGMGMLAALMGCSSSYSSKTTGPTITITASANGYTSPQTVGSPFGTLSATVLSNGSPASGVSVTFTAPATGASGTFATNPVAATDIEMTNSSGVATSQIFTANTTAGSYSVTATTSGATTPASFSLANNAGNSTALAAGNYVFSVKGTDSGSANCSGLVLPCPSVYIAVGAFTVSNTGTITTGEMDFSDFNYFAGADPITGGSVASSPDAAQGDTNLIITIITGDTNFGLGAPTGAGNGTLVLNTSMASSNRGQIAEYDTWASGSGELNLQNLPTPNTDLCPNAATTACGYAYFADGWDINGGSIGMGGVIRVDGASGAISGTGSVFDVNDGCASVSGGVTCVSGVFPGQTLTASAVSAPDSSGLVTFSLNSACSWCFGGNPVAIIMDGYMVTPSLIRVVETASDNLFATTGGTMVAQTGVGGFSSSSISGSSYVLRSGGADVNGVLQASGVITFNAGGTVGGNLAFNDIAAQSPQGGTAVTGGTYTVDATGRVTVTGVTPFNYNLQFYLNGGNTGNAPMISMDATAANPDVLAGYSWQQSAGLSASSFSGNYALGVAEFVASGGNEFEFNGDGVASGTSLTLSGYLDQNQSLAGGAPSPDKAIGGTYASTATNGVVTVTGSGSSLFTAYLIDATQGVIIENDSGQLLSGFFANH